MIDLHTHTDESDGSVSPGQLVRTAAAMRIEALGITDHDTFAGYDLAVPCAAELGLHLICGIELSAKYHGRSVYLLGYFLRGAPTQDFRDWVTGLQGARHDRNRRLVDKLRTQGVQITLDEVHQRGRGLPGRPHFASILVEKGYVASVQQAFDLYLDESGKCFVARDEPTLAECVERIVAAGGLPSLPHPGRVSLDPQVLEESVREMQGFGLKAIEVFHSDHSAAARDSYQTIASRLSLAVTGGSDFHGETKPTIALGTGINGNLNVSRSVLDHLLDAGEVSTCGKSRRSQ
jgi:3',5'-nucleoside bisphosphate phosphatase